MRRDYVKSNNSARASIIESVKFPMFKKLLEQSPVDYKSSKADLIVNALLQDENLSKYTLMSIFDDRILVTDNGHSFYHLPYSFDENNKLKFSTIIPTTLVQNESMLIKTVLLNEVSKLIGDYTKGNVTSNVDAIIELALEKLKLDNIDKALDKTVYEETVPVILFRSPIIIESWNEYIAMASTDLVKRTNSILESCETLYGFRKFLESVKGVKFGYYVDARDVDGLIEEYAKYRGTDLSEVERATLINFYKNRVRFLHESLTLYPKASTINEGIITDFDILNPSVYGQEVTADSSTENTALNKSLLINYKPILVDAREFLMKLASTALPGDLKKVVSNLLSKVDTTLVRMDTNYAWAMQDMYDLQDLLRTLNKMIAVATGLDTIKATLGVEVKGTESPKKDKSVIPTMSYVNPDTFETTVGANIASYPRPFYSRTPLGNAYPEPSRVGESVIIRDGAYFREGTVKSFNLYTGLYEVACPDGKVYNLEGYQVEFKEDDSNTILNKPKEEPDIMPTVEPEDTADILLDKSKECKAKV